MPKLDTFTLEIKTGENRGPENPQYNINGFPLDFDEVEGGTDSGETLVAKGSPQSFPHKLTLSGPQEGKWDIEHINATYTCAGEEPYTVHLGEVTLDDESDLNIWHERPIPAFDV